MVKSSKSDDLAQTPFFTGTYTVSKKLVVWPRETNKKFGENNTHSLHGYIYYDHTS